MSWCVYMYVYIYIWHRIIKTGWRNFKLSRVRRSWSEGEKSTPRCPAGMQQASVSSSESKSGLRVVIRILKISGQYPDQKQALASWSEVDLIAWSGYRRPQQQHQKLGLCVVTWRRPQYHGQRQASASWSEWAEEVPSVLYGIWKQVSESVSLSE